MECVSGDLTVAVDKFIKSNKVMIFSKSTCPYCNKVKKLFDSLGVKYFSLELDKLDNGSEIQSVLASKVGRRTVPQVFIGGSHLGGCDDTMTADRNGKLKNLLSTIDDGDTNQNITEGEAGSLSVSKV